MFTRIYYCLTWQKKCYYFSSPFSSSSFLSSSSSSFLSSSSHIFFSYILFFLIFYILFFLSCQSATSVQCKSHFLDENWFKHRRDLWMWSHHVFISDFLQGKRLKSLWYGYSLNILIYSKPITIDLRFCQTNLDKRSGWQNFIIKNVATCKLIQKKVF